MGSLNVLRLGYGITNVMIASMTAADWDIAMLGNVSVLKVLSRLLKGSVFAKIQTMRDA
jgi:hypothetical protein